MDHEGEEGRLGPVEVVYAVSVGDEAAAAAAEGKHVFNDELGGGEHVAENEAINYPVRVPVIGFAEAAAGDEEGVRQGD